MREKTRKLILSIFLAASIVALMAASLAYTITHGRYTGGRLDAESPYDQIIDFVGATKYTVSTPEELVNAIENGYSYIEIGKDAPDPFVINNNIADVATNLVLNVNGHTVVRNSRNPLINVQKNVSVVLVYDSESIDESTPEEDMGGFYNPVGSALQASGGTLTVGQGKYESGPRAGDTQESVGGTKEVTVYHRGGDRGAAAYTETTQASMPAGGKDMYFGKAPASGGNDFIKEDTFLIYTEEKNGYIPAEGEENAGKLIVHVEENADGSLSGDEFSVPCNVASCDFYYYYPTEEGKTTVGGQEVQTYAVVYGYNDVKALAEKERTDLTQTNGRDAGNVLVWPYAAIRSLAGSAYARGGEFYTHFGTENTYGIYSSGGIMTVGGEASAAPIFSAQGLGTCIYMAAEEAADGGQDKNILTIDSGEFSSEIGDTIEMHGGTMNIKSGSFTKDAAGNSGDDNGSAIFISGGKLNSAEAEDPSKPIQFTLSGSHVNGILAEGGEVNIANAAFTFAEGEHNQGVYNNGGTSRVRWCDFTLPGNNNYGLHSTNGTTRASDCTIQMTGEYAVGVYTTGGRALVEGGKIDIDFADAKANTLLTSAAVSTEGGEIYLAGSLTIDSSSLGVTVREVGTTEGSLEIADKEIVIGKKTYSVAQGNVTIYTPNATGIYVNNGSLTNKGTVKVESYVGDADGKDNGWNWVGADGNPNTSFNKYNGVYVQGGSLVSEGTLDVTFRGVENKESGDYLTQQIESYAVRVEQAAAGGATEVTITKGTISNAVGGGVYVGGGAVTLGDGSTGPTVETEGNLLYASVTKHDGGFWGDDSYTWDGWKHVVNGSWQYMLNKSGGHAVEVSGGSLTVYGGSYSAQQGNGILIRNTSDGKVSNEVTINGGSFIGYNGGYYVDYGYEQSPLGEGGRMVGPAASYGLNVMGHDLKVTINGGSFGENGSVGNSAASFFGSPGGDNSKNAQVNVCGGSFNAHNADAISIFRYIDITFDGTSSPISSKITGPSAVASLSVQDDLLYKDDLERGSTITLRNGTFTGTAYGVWYACGYDKLNISGGTFTGTSETGLHMNQGTSAANTIQISGGTFTGGKDGLYYGKNGNVVHGLVISGGEFTGERRSGLYFNVNQWANGDGNVSITGGTFRGKPTEHSQYVASEVRLRYWYTDGAIGADSKRTDGVGWDIQISDLVDQGRSVDYYSNETTIALTHTIDAQLTTERDQIALNVTGCKYSKVVIR